jgi:pimeloyl-ACP methyl ester carboxylesterase
MLLTAFMIGTLVVTGAPPAHAAPEQPKRSLSGEINGVPYRVEVPPNWNGTLLLYHHGMYAPGQVPERIELTNSPAAEPELLRQGYALAASLFAKPQGFSAPVAIRDDIALLNWFQRRIGTPKKVLAWGASGGGLNSMLLSERYPHRIDGVLPMCAPVAGASALFTPLLDMGFAVQKLLAPDLEFVRIDDPAANQARAVQVISAAARTPAGRARLALAGAFADVPGWSRVFRPRPRDVAEQVRQQARAMEVYALLAWGPLRADLEDMAGGNPTGNVGVDYRRLLQRSSERKLVQRAYRAAGLSLSADLNTLRVAPRVAAEPGPARWLARNGTPTGSDRTPVVTLHATGDIIPAEHVPTYAVRVSPTRLRQLYVQRAGHCQHTAAEEVTAVRVLHKRVRTGRWSTTSPTVLNAAARRYGPGMNGLFDWIYNVEGTAAPAFVRYRPRLLPRVR